MWSVDWVEIDVVVGLMRVMNVSVRKALTTLSTAGGERDVGWVGWGKRW